MDTFILQVVLLITYYYCGNLQIKVMGYRKAGHGLKAWWKPEIATKSNKLI